MFDPLQKPEGAACGACVFFCADSSVYAGMMMVSVSAKEADAESISVDFDDAVPSRYDGVCGFELPGHGHAPVRVAEWCHLFSRKPETV